MGNGVQKIGELNFRKTNSIRPWVGAGEKPPENNHKPHRGAFDQTPSPRSVSLLRRAYEPQDRDGDPRSQDDSVVYSESKSARHGARLRPQRRGESFSIRSTSKRPTSWHPVNESTKSDVSLRSSLKAPGGATSNAETSKKYKSKTPCGAQLAPASSMQFGAPASDALSMTSYQSFQSLQNLGPASKSTASLAEAGGAVPLHMTSSMSWHGTGSASQPALNKQPMQPPPVEPRRKLQNSGGCVNSAAPAGGGREPYLVSRSRSGSFPATECDKGSRAGFLSYSQSQVQLQTHSRNYGPPTTSAPIAHSMQDVRQHQGVGKDYNSYGGWSRPTPYKPNNYENIDAFENAKSNAAASLSHGSLVQAQAYSHSYTNFAQSRTISEEGFVPRGEDDLKSDPPDIPPWPQPDHRQMLSEDSGVELSMTLPPPPLPPGRDDSRGLYLLNSSRSNERLSSWPSASQAQVEEEEQDKGRAGSRAHSWSSYQPRLNAHLEESRDNKQVHYTHRAVIGNGEGVGQAVGYGAMDTKGDVELKNLYNAKPTYPAYGYETNYDVFKASKASNQKGETSAVDDLFQYASQSRELGAGQPSSAGLSPPPLPQTAPPLPQSAPPLPQTAPPALPQTAPPLPQTAPPPMPQKARTGSSSGHTIIVHQKPFYNTGTQTEISPSPKSPSSQYFSGPPLPSPRSGQLAQPMPMEPAYRNVEIQVNMDLVMVTPMVTPMSTLERRKNKKADQGCQVQPFMLPEMLNNSPLSVGIAHPPLSQQQLSPVDNYGEMNSFHRTAPIIDKMTQENRIPETIREESPKKYENAKTAQGMCGTSQEVKDSILQSIHDHSPSQTSIMRKLSREFFGNQMKSNYSSHPTLLTVPETQMQQTQQTQRRRSGEPPLLRQSKEYWSPNDMENNKTTANKPPPCVEPMLKDGDALKDGKKKMDRSKKLSLRKAFGIFDEIESVDDPNRRYLGSHGKSMSASHVGMTRNHHIYPESKEVPPGAPTEEKPHRWYNRTKGDEIHKEALHQRYDSGHFSQEESNSSKIAQKVAFPINDSHVKKLHRTSSEQIRPVKERIAECERAIDTSIGSEIELRRQKAPDATCLKVSDPSEYLGKGSAGGVQAPGHRSSDPSMEDYRRGMEKTAVNQHRLSDPASSQRDKRLSGDSDVFRGSYELPSLQRRPGSVRSTSSSSLDGHRMSDPELKKMQHMAVLNFFEMKTGKRLSSSSMDSSGNSKYNSLSSRGSSSVDSAVGLYRERSPSPQKVSDESQLYTQENPITAMKKSKSLPRDMAGHIEEGSATLSLSLSLPPPPTDQVPTTVISSRPTSGRDRRRSAPSGRRLSHHKKEKSAPSQMESYQVAPLESTVRTGKSHHAAPQTAGRNATTDDQLSPVGATDSSDRQDTNESPDPSLTLPKQTYEYSSSSSGSSSPTKSPATSSYQVTANKVFNDNDGSPPPPVLPPRNYRSSDRPPATTAEHKFRPPPTPPSTTSSTAAFGGDIMTDFNTPQPDHYANQLRQQMRRQFSAQSGVGVGATRHQSKTLAEVKQGVAMSRPVDRPLVPQEAVAPPQPLPRSTAVPELSLELDGHGYPDGTKSARELSTTTSASSSHKIDGIHMSSGHTTSQQQQTQHAHHNHHQHHPQQQSHHQQHMHTQPQQQTHSQHHHHHNNNHPHHHPSHMQQSHSLTNINLRTLDAAPVAAPRERDQLNNRPPVEQRQHPVPPDQNRNSPKGRSTTTPPVLEVPPPPTFPPPVDDDETLEKQPFPLPQSSPPPLPVEPENDAQNRLSFDDEADVSSQKYSNESYMTKKNNSRQGFNGNYRRSNSNEIPKPATTTTPPPAVTSTSEPQLLNTGTTTTSGLAPTARHDHRDAVAVAPLSPGSTNPPKTETLIKAPTVVTVNKTMPTIESKTQVVEVGPMRTPISGKTSGSHHHGTPPPVPPKYGRAAPLPVTVASTPPTEQRLRNPTLEDRVGSQGSLDAPAEFILSGRPGVTNLDEASLLLNKLNSSRGNLSGSPQGSTASSSSSGLVTSWTPKATTPTPDTPTSTFSSSRERLSALTRKSEENLSSASRMNGLNGHSSNHSSPDTSLTRTRHTLISRSTPDSPPSLSTCPPPAIPTKESTSKELKEQAELPEQETTKPEEEVKPVSLGSPVHVRQKSVEEIECEKVAAVVAIQIVDDDKQLSDVILPPPEHKMTTDFMLGLFAVDDLPPVPSFAANRLSPRTKDESNKENKRSLETSPSPASSPCWSPPSVASLQNKMREEGMKREEILREMGVPDTSLQRQKEELEARIKQKLSILRTEKDELREDITDNELIGKEVTSVVEKKVQNKGEFDKYKLYVDELDKVMYLLLKLSGRLARAENAVMSLPPTADEKEKLLLQMKRDEASEKHADAKLLKQGIDRRSQQVSSFLQRYLTQEEFDNYTYYIKMKSKLTMEQQEIDDKIKLGDDQLRALKRSMQR